MALSNSAPSSTPQSLSSAHARGGGENGGDSSAHARGGGERGEGESVSNYTPVSGSNNQQGLERARPKLTVERVTIERARPKLPHMAKDAASRESAPGDCIDTILVDATALNFPICLQSFVSNHHRAKQRFIDAAKEYFSRNPYRAEYSNYSDIDQNVHCTDLASSDCCFVPPAGADGMTTLDC